MGHLDDIDEYFKVFGMLFVSCFGVPIPEEIPVIYGGVKVGLAYENPNSALYWGIMLPVLIVSIVVCDGMLYFIGRRWGKGLLKHPWMERNLLPKDKREKIEKNFHEYGISILLFARLLPGARMPIFMMSGMMHIPLRKFLLADGIYAVPGATILFGLGYWLGKDFEDWFTALKENPLITVLTILVAIGLFIGYVYLKKRIPTGEPKDLPLIGEPISHLIPHEHKETPEEKSKPSMPIRILGAFKQAGGFVAALFSRNKKIPDPKPKVIDSSTIHPDSKPNLESPQPEAQPQENQAEKKPS